MEYQPSFPLKTVLVVAIIGSLLLYSILFIFHTQPDHKKATRGTSAFAAFDMVSGEIPTTMQKRVLDTLSLYTGTSLNWGDVSLQSGSYKKQYDDNGVGIRATLDIPKVKTSYDIVMQGRDSSNLKLAVYCSVHLPTGYACLFSDAVRSGE